MRPPLSNFTYILDGKIAGSGRPGYGKNLRENLLWLHEEGIRAVVTLTPEELPEAALRETNLQSSHIPVPDFAAPTPAQIREGVDFIRLRLDAGEPVLVHCGSGYGRTGTMLACYLVSTGMDSDQAIETVRRKRSGSIETSEQEEAVHAYAASLEGR